MLSKAVELALREGLQAEELRKLKDETLIFTLARRFAGHPEIAHLIRSFESRQLYKSCFTLTSSSGEARQQDIVHRFHYGLEERDRAERAIAAVAGIEPRQIIIYCPSIGMSLPEAEVPVRWEGGRRLPLSGSNNDEIRVLKEKHKALWKFFVFIDREVADKADLVRRASEEYL